MTDPKHPASRPDPKVQYIWDLAADAEGNLYAATGPTGQLWKRSRDGKWSLLFDSKATHLLCVAVAADGTIYAGSDGEGLIYRVGRATARRRSSTMPPSPKSERFSSPPTARSTPARRPRPAAAGPGPGCGRALLRSEERQALGDSVLASTRARRRATRPRPRRSTVQRASRRPCRRPRRPSPPPAAGSAAPRPISPGDNAVYRLDADGVAREVFRAKALILRPVPGRTIGCFVGTGPGRPALRGPRPGARDTPAGEAGQRPDSLAPGRARRRHPPGHRRSRLGGAALIRASCAREAGLRGHDAKLLSRFGALSWRAELPAGTSIALQVRTGNVGEPDETWSAWSAAQTDPTLGAGRFAAGPFRPVPGRAVDHGTPSSTPELLQRGTLVTDPPTSPRRSIGSTFPT